MEKLFTIPYIKYSIITFVTLLIAFVISKILSLILFAGAVILAAIALFASQLSFEDKQNGIEIPFPYRTIVFKDK